MSAGDVEVLLAVLALLALGVVVVGAVVLFGRRD